MDRICNILVVEDDDAVRVLLGEVLDLAGYTFVLARGSSDMRQALAAGEFDVAIIDVSLRDDEDGFTLAKEARAKGCAVVLTTGDPGQRARLEGSGENHLMKPFRMRRLALLIDRVLKKNRALCVPRAGSDPLAVRI